MSFELHPRLAQDCFHLCDLKLCRVLLMNESRYPWFILVPMKQNLRELLELSEQDAQQYWLESCFMQRFLNNELKAEKLNVAALGNMVPQLHIHHIARSSEDAAWPAPVWGRFPPEPYPSSVKETLQKQFLKFKGEHFK